MDPSETWGGVVAALALVALNGFFVAAEFSMVKVRATQLAGLTGSRAGLAAHMVAHLDSLSLEKKNR